MPRASRYLLEGYTYHLTQRCRNREFLLRFAKDRDAYRHWLREGVLRYRVPLYAYCLTSSHVHLLVHADEVHAVGRLMDLAAGATAQPYNRRKGRSGAMWEPYQCTIIEDGKHLFNCLRYIDLNMVRAGVVKHPAEWRWCGWSELMGCRQRYRLLNVERLLQSLDMPDLDSFREAYAEAVNAALRQNELRREPMWTESLAVGSREFVKEAAARFSRRYRFAMEEIHSPQADGVWTLRETTSPYGSISGGKSSA